MGLIEFARLREIMTRFFPPPPAVVADVGGGPGVYSCLLASEGYEVHLIDPVPMHVEQAQEASARQPEYPIASARIGDARELPFPEAGNELTPLIPLSFTKERGSYTQSGGGFRLGALG